MMPRVYFGHADLQMRPFLNDEEFLRSFIARVLIEGDLAVADAFFFMSEHLARALRQPGLIREALREGIIRPLFRREGTTTFTEALAVIRMQGIVGELPDADEIARELDELGKPRGIEYWPRDLVGLSFRDEVTNVFYDDAPPIDDPVAVEIWRSARVQKWRVDCVKEALQESDGTLRRGELLHLVGVEMGWREDHKIRDAQELLAFAATVGLEELARPYVAWVNQLYQRNQAKLFRLDAAMWSGHAVEQLGLYALLPEGSARMELIQQAIPIPSPNTLSADPEAWFAIRRSAGKTYFEHLQEWRHGTREAGDVLDAFEAYAASLRETFPVSPIVALEYDLSDDAVPASRGLLNARLSETSVGLLVGDGVCGAVAISPAHARWLARKRTAFAVEPSMEATRARDVSLNR